MVATRRLAAILAADVAGYSRLIGADEQETLTLLKAFRADVIDPAIAAHSGRIVKTTGDGLLAEFGSTVDALRCALEVQANLKKHNVSFAPDKLFEFRIGIHQGDILVEDDDIFGDGVNIAARLEELAEPGGICVSARVQEDAAGKIFIPYRDLGERRLHNIARPVRVYSIAPSAQPQGPLRRGLTDWLARHRQTSSPASQTLPPPISAPPAVTSAKLPAPLSIVVLPFANLSNDAEEEYFADGITDDVTTDLSRISESFVISPSTAFSYKGKPIIVKQIARELAVRYALEGSVRRLGERVQVNVQLTDGESGAVVWADRFDTGRRSLAEAQAEITGRLASTLGLELVRDAGRRVEEQRAADPAATDLVLQGRSLISRVWSPENRENAMTAFERALLLDPHSLDARLGLALALAVGSHANGPDTRLDAVRAEQLLREVMERDPHLSEGYRVLAILKTAEGHWDDAISSLRTALSLDPNNAAAMRNLGQRLHLIGQSEAGMPYMEKALRLSPRDPGVAFGYLNLGLAYLFLGRSDEAMDMLRRAMAASPRIYYMHLALAGALGQRGELDEARSELHEAKTLKRDMISVADWREDLRSRGNGHLEFLAQMDRSVFEGLRRAGFPET
jgi:adenylate cyclase